MILSLEQLLDQIQLGPKLVLEEKKISKALKHQENCGELTSLSWKERVDRDQKKEEETKHSFATRKNTTQKRKNTGECG